MNVLVFLNALEIIYLVRNILVRCLVIHSFLCVVWRGSSVQSRLVRRLSSRNGGGIGSLWLARPGGSIFGPFSRRFAVIIIFCRGTRRIINLFLKLKCLIFINCICCSILLCRSDFITTGLVDLIITRFISSRYSKKEPHWPCHTKYKNRPIFST